jgi:hypothetical protein
MAQMVPGPLQGESWDKPDAVPASPAVPAPELSSLATALDDLTRRVTGIGEGLANTSADWVAQDLFAVERSLRAAHRRLASLNERLRKQG